MQLYILVATEDEEEIERAVRNSFEDRLIYELSDSAWLIAGKGTSSDTWAQIFEDEEEDEEEDDNGRNGTFIVAFKDYFGYQPSNVWSWIEARVKEKPSGGTAKTE